VGLSPLTTILFRTHSISFFPFLSAEQVQATFFVIGAEFEQNMAEGRRLVAAGHEMGNHTYSHERMVLVTPSFVRQEIERSDQLIREAGYQCEILFRPPYGKKLFTLPRYLAKNGQHTRSPPGPCRHSSDHSSLLVRFLL
jgi:peptidoglycan/xylan/chitin deacetylase (PgdA/CDA1 family)